MAYIDFTSVTTSSITVRLAGLDTASQSNMGTSNVPRHNSYKISVLGDQRTLSKGTGGFSGSATYSGLSSGTEYHFVATISFTGTSGVTSDVGIEDYCFTEDASLKPSNWEWWTTKVSGEGIYLGHQEWASFCGRINEFRDYKGLSAYLFTIPSSGDYITNTIINQARNAIYAMSPPGVDPGLVYAGGNIYASYFNKLRDYLNSIN